MPSRTRSGSSPACPSSIRPIALMIWPGVQKPHWKPSCAMKAACTGCSWSPRATPSMVRMSAPSWLTARARHELIRRPSTRTVHAPHWPRSHPFLVPVRSQTLAQQIEQRDARVFKLDVPPHTVNGEADGEVHAGLRSVLWSNGIADTGTRRGHVASIGVAVRIQAATRIYGGDPSAFTRGRGSQNKCADDRSVRSNRSKAPRRCGSQSRARAGGGEGRVQRRRPGREPRGRGQDAPASASERFIATSRRARRCSRRSIGARWSSSASWRNN